MKTNSQITCIQSLMIFSKVIPPNNPYWIIGHVLVHVTRRALIDRKIRPSLILVSVFRLDLPSFIFLVFKGTSINDVAIFSWIFVPICRPIGPSLSLPNNFIYQIYWSHSLILFKVKHFYWSNLPVLFMVKILFVVELMVNKMNTFSIFKMSDFESTGKFYG